MKKNSIIFTLLCFTQLFFAQNVFLTKVEKTNDNQDKFFYHLENNVESAEYLGEVEVQGYSTDDVAIFNQIYKKAKEIGANSFSLKNNESIDGTFQKLDPSNYKINLYFLPKDKFPVQDNSLFLFASSSKTQKISINDKNYSLLPRMYIRIKLSLGEIYTISTKGILGSTIKVKEEKSQSNQYFQLSSLKMGGNNQNDGTLHLKSGDIMGLERSYAEFLKLIYQQSK